MPLIIWKDSYLTGFQDIDTQHQKLVEIINNLFDAISKKEKDEIVEHALSQLIDYSITHFRHEEDLMIRYRYLDYSNHRKEHLHFMEKVNGFRKDFVPGNNKVMLEIINFLKDWLLNHIMLTDRKYIQTFHNFGYQ